MDDRLKGLALGVARMVLVGLALVLALGSVASSAVRTFCPDTTTASGPVVIAAGSSTSLAAVVEDDTEVPSEAAPDPLEDATVPAEDATEPAQDAVPDGSCVGGVRACAPPLLSSVLRYGDDVCADQAPGELRGRMIPPLFGAFALLGGAWALRPRHGEAVLSRD